MTEPEVARRSVGREYLEALLIAVIFAVFARTFVVQAFKIPSGSMEQNLLIGDHILVNKFIYGQGTGPRGGLLPMRPLERGDVVVFKYPEDPRRDFIKRCVGLPGDRVEIRNKRLFLNGAEVDDAGYVFHSDANLYPNSRFAESMRYRDNFGPYTVPERHYFCLGDNRDNSLDSRSWGSVPAEYLKGRAFVVYWSFPPAPEGHGLLRRLGRLPAGFFTQTRWERTFRIVR